MPATLHIYSTPLLNNCRDRPSISVQITQKKGRKKENETFIHHAIAIYVPTMNMPLIYKVVNVKI